MVGIGAVGVAVALVGAVKTTQSVDLARTQARIWRNGASTEGTVLSVEPTLVNVNRSNLRMWIVRYEYCDSAGQRHKGTSQHMLGDNANAWKVGDRVPIRYDRDRPHLSVWTSS
jgi:hypothetical protein